jgi:hypothetical protein
MYVAKDNITIILVTINALADVNQAVLLNILPDFCPFAQHLTTFANKPVFIVWGINKAESRTTLMAERKDCVGSNFTLNLIQYKRIGVFKIELVERSLALFNSQMQLVCIIKAQQRA